jgi:hypothetical protein
MIPKTFLLYNKTNEFVVDKLLSRIHNSYVPKYKIYSETLELTEEVLLEMTKIASGSFYVVKTDREIFFPNFDFLFEPPVWDSKYIHIWNNDSTVRLYHSDHVKSNPARYTDKEMFEGRAELKVIQGKIYTYPIFDIVFLSYDEPFADEHYEKLSARFPRAKRVHGVQGILAAHLEASRKTKTDMFYVVDADAEIVPSFNFDYQPHSLDRLSVHVWYSKNPVNGLEYGYGGVKLFPKQLLIGYKDTPVDFTTSVSKSLKVIPEISNITKFNTDPFSAWRSGFRECAKLASKIIHNQDNTDTEKRLDVWCSVGENAEFGDFAMMGAREGRDFGLKYADKPELGLINDFAWLEKKFTES